MLIIVDVDSLASLDGPDRRPTCLLAARDGVRVRRASAEGRDFRLTRSGGGRRGRIRPIARRCLQFARGGLCLARPCPAVVLDERGTGRRRTDGELLQPSAQVTSPLELLRALVGPDTLELVVSPHGRGTEEKQRRKPEAGEEALPSSRPTCPSGQQSRPNYSSEFGHATHKARYASEPDAPLLRRGSDARTRQNRSPWLSWPGGDPWAAGPSRP